MCASIDLSWLLSPKDYFYAGVSAVIGTYLGIQWAKGQFKSQVLKDEEKVRQGILDSLKFNRERAEQAVKQLREKGMPNYPLDGARLSALVVRAHGLLPDDLLRALDWHRYQMDHITSKLSVINSFFLSASVSTPETERAYKEWIHMLRESLIEHYQQLVDGTDGLVTAITNQPNGTSLKQ